MHIYNNLTVITDKTVQESTEKDGPSSDMHFIFMKKNVNCIM